MRNSFIPPIPELELAANHLDLAANAILALDYHAARLHISQADYPEICAFTSKITGRIDPAIHWQHSMPSFSTKSSEREKLRMPSAAEERVIFARDGWRCRYCGCRVISKKARSIIIKLFPDTVRWGVGNAKQHCGLTTLAASLDHILPHCRGGNNEPTNLVTACTPCQFGRAHWTLEEVGFSDPRDRSPVIDGWDGLVRLLGKKFSEQSLIAIGLSD